MLRLIAALVLLITLAVESAAQVPAVSFDLARVQRATVQIMQARTTGGSTQITCVSSGSLITPTGLILTNAHGTVQNESCDGNLLIVAISVRDGEPPVPTFRAQVIQADDGLDIALLQISAELNGQPIDSTSLSLPYTEVARPGDVALDETVYVVGFPGIGDDPTVVVQASVQGFTAEPRAEKSWLKVRAVQGDVTISGPMSGGGAYNRSGQLVGIPTIAPLVRTSDTSICIQIQDTNQDGLITLQDACVPLGGSINTIRPVAFALPLIQSAQLGISIRTSSETALASSPFPQISNLFFAPSVTNGMPTTVLADLPAGATSLYLFFDYRGMRPTTVYELRVAVDGVTSTVFSLPPVRWSGGEAGLWYIGLTGQALPNGEYTFMLLVNGQVSGDPKTIQVGGGAQSRPTFRSIAFLVSTGENQAFGNGYILGRGSTVTAQFTYDNMVDGIEWAGVWYFGGQELEPRVGGQWNTGQANGSQSTSFTVPGGLLPGRYRLELYIQGTLSALADFTVAGIQEELRPRVFSRQRFVAAETPADAIGAQPVTSVTTSIQRLFAVFDWESIAVGTLWQVTISVDDRVLFDRIAPWTLPEDGAGYWIELTANTVLPDGRYRLDLQMNGILLQRVETEVGIGQLPIDIFAQGAGVLLRGRVIDADSRLGVENVTIVVLSEQFSVEDYLALADQVFTMATTDRDGRYQFSDLLRYNVPYSIIINTDGYLPITADGIVVDETTANPLEIDIYLTKG